MIVYSTSGAPAVSFRDEATGNVYYRTEYEGRYILQAAPINQDGSVAWDEACDVFPENVTEDVWERCQDIAWELEAATFRLITSAGA